MLISFNEKDKYEVLDVARSLAADGFTILATSGTYAALKAAGIQAQKAKKLV